MMTQPNTRLLVLLLLLLALAGLSACAPSSASDDSAAPVSYTHLDVYKRQPVNGSREALFAFAQTVIDRNAKRIRQSQHNVQRRVARNARLNLRDGRLRHAD